MSIAILNVAEEGEGEDDTRLQVRGRWWGMGVEQVRRRWVEAVGGGEQVQGRWWETCGAGQEAVGEGGGGGGEQVRGGGGRHVWSRCGAGRKTGHVCDKCGAGV